MVWNFAEKKLLHSSKADTEVIQMGYCQLNKTFAFLDFESNLGFWHKQFPQFALTVNQHMEDASMGNSVGLEQNFHSVNPNELHQEIDQEFDVDVGDIQLSQPHEPEQKQQSVASQQPVPTMQNPFTQS